MLAADKLQLQSALKQQATALKEKEFNLHHSNFMTVGTQAAVLAGLDITMFIEFNPPANLSWGEHLTHLPRFLKFIYYMTIVSAFCANMIVVSHTTALSVLGAGMALRGPDGSMMVATDEMYIERKHVFRIFGYGLACTVGSVLICVWLILQWEAALACMILTYMTCRTIWQNYQRVQKKFYYDESQTVDFRDIMEGPAAIQAIPWKGVTAALRGAKQAPRKSASVPLEVDDESSRSLDSRSYDRFDMEWQSNQNSDPKSDCVKRRTKTSPPNSNNQEHYIQTI